MNKKNILITERNNNCRIAAFTYFAAHTLAKHGFRCDYSYPNSGLAVRHVHPQKGWAVIVRASYAHVSVENDTPGGIESDENLAFVDDLLKDGLFEDGGPGCLNADFESPLEEIWACIEPYASDKKILEIFSRTEKVAEKPAA